MTAETYLLYVAPLMLLGFGAAMHAVLSALDARKQELKPVRVVARRRDVRR